MRTIWSLWWATSLVGAVAIPEKLPVNILDDTNTRSTWVKKYKSVSSDSSVNIPSVFASKEEIVDWSLDSADPAWASPVAMGDGLVRKAVTSMVELLHF
ncbi:hypothetical protein CHU98_g5850 [Xylaria longipes]|nr:hypothetical protein CHU98_g5850 [Xylaria longipes]